MEFVDEQNKPTRIKYHGIKNINRIAEERYDVHLICINPILPTEVVLRKHDPGQTYLNCILMD